MRTANIILWLAIIAGPLALIPPAHAHVLFPNDPDPFCPENGGTEIRYDLAAAIQVKLEIVDYYGSTARVLVDASQPAGQHLVVWDGGDGSGDMVGTGGFTIAFTADIDSLSDPCTVFCGDDLEGPYRKRIAGQDQLVAFGLGLNAAEQTELVILGADSTTSVRVLIDGVLDAGVHMVEWDLRDDGDSRVPGGLYVCRLTTPHYDEQIAFWINNPIEPASFTLSLEDKYGVLRVGSPDSLTPTVVETPLGGARITFGRPLTPPELDHFWSTLELTGALGYLLIPDSLVFSPDTSWVEITCIQNMRPWEDIFGRGTAVTDSLWMDPWVSHFQFRHTFEGITWFSVDCDTCGPVDTLDWHCWIYEPDSSLALRPAMGISPYESYGLAWPLLKGISPVDPDPVSRLRCACPNPVMPGTFVRIRFSNATSGLTRVLIVNQEGYLVRTIADGVLSPGMFSYTWDLRNDQGASLPNGIYHVIYDLGPDWDCVCSGDIWISPDGASVDPSGERQMENLNLTALPNPALSLGGTQIGFRLAEPGILGVSIYDSAGRRVRTLMVPHLLDGGYHSLVWNHRDESDQTVAPGIYFVSLRSGPEVSNLKIVLLR
jgi:flagellar hook assembly protein FlgD